MQIKQPGMFSRGKITLGPSPHITPESLAHELGQAWAPRGFNIYKSSLFGVDVVLKKSGWTGIALKIKQTPTGATEIIYNPFMPSALVRIMAMGLIPVLIVNSSSWQPLLRTFEQYLQASPFFNAGQLGGGQQAMLPQAVAHYPQGQAQQHQQHQQHQQQHQQPQQQAQGAPPQYPCASCGTTLQWVAEHQRWFCGRCQQYR